MTKFLLRIFTSGAEDPRSPAVRSAIGKLSGAVGLGCNLLLFGVKLLAGILSGSVAITADALNNLSDATSSVVTLLGFKLAERPADEHHPYGHARYEYLSGLAVAAIIIVIGFELAKSALGKIIHPTAVEFSTLTVLILCSSIALKLWMALFNKKLGRMIGSGALEAAAADSRNDCLATGAVLLSGLIRWATHWDTDGLMGLAVAVFILYSGWNLAKSTISPLLGEGADPQLQAQIAAFISANPKVLGYHDLMVHDYGPGQRFASMHVEMDQQADPLVCHELIDNLERACLRSYNVHLVLHYDPVVTGDPELERLRGVVQQLLLQQDERISIHDFRMVCGKGHTNLIFDIALPMELMPKQKQVKGTLDEALNALGETTYYTVVTFDMAAFN